MQFCQKEEVCPNHQYSFPARFPYVSDGVLIVFSPSSNGFRIVLAFLEFGEIIRLVKIFDFGSSDVGVMISSSSMPKIKDTTNKAEM